MVTIRSGAAAGAPPARLPPSQTTASALRMNQRCLVLFTGGGILATPKYYFHYKGALQLRQALGTVAGRPWEGLMETVKAAARGAAGRYGAVGPAEPQKERRRGDALLYRKYAQYR